MKYLENTLETYIYIYCNMCNIPIYFWNIPIYFSNIDIKHLQHTFETPETFETYVCNMRFQRNISLPLRRMEARRRVEVTGVLVDGAELTSNTELGCGAQRAGWERHRRWWRAAAVAQTVGGASGRSDAVTPRFSNYKSALIMRWREYFTRYQITSVATIKLHVICAKSIALGFSILI
jgi:hypothetical protein